MRDDGNFVLFGADGTVVWQTFESPTDTLVAGQDLVPAAQLFSGVSDTNKAVGKYQLTNQQQDSNLVLYPVGTPNDAASSYWNTGTFDLGFTLILRLDTSGLLYQVNNDGSFTKNLTQPGALKAGEQANYRLTLDPDGVLRLYRHAFVSGGASNTTVAWSALTGRCLVHGVCGYKSYCVLDQDRPSCLCPHGFDFVNASNSALGCTVNSGDCKGGQQQDTVDFSVKFMSNMEWADIPYEVVGKATSAADCMTACMADCLCVAVLQDADKGTCSKQQLPLRYGRRGGRYTLFVKTAGAATNGSKPIGRTTIIMLEEEVAPLRSYSYQEMERATYCFRDPVGRGAFGTVFKGALRNCEKAIAVKRLEKLVEDGEREFQREVRAIRRTSHRNLVRLLGFCHEGAHRLLVYEFMSNGSVADLLFRGASTPSWSDCLGIALDVARGLHYLHDELSSRVTHCDVKPQNILIDAAGTAKIADFRLAKLLQPNQTRTFTGVRGTRGYLAPEWYRGTGPVTAKVDVYS
nr:G-type lectin S-receptor-like serine/threonine-protein kinase LECRK1 [Aegilops tauschii subsp. strangulata]